MKFFNQNNILGVSLLILSIVFFYYIYSENREKRSELEYKCYEAGQIREKEDRIKAGNDERNIATPPLFKYDHNSQRCLYSYSSYYFSPDGTIDSGYIYSLYDNSSVAFYVNIDDKPVYGNQSEYSKLFNEFFISDK